MIKVEHLRKMYGDVAAVDDAAFTAHAGEIFGLLGPNGFLPPTHPTASRRYSRRSPQRERTFAGQP